MRRNRNELQNTMCQAAAVYMERKAGICEPEWPLSQDAPNMEIEPAWDVLQTLVAMSQVLNRLDIMRRSRRRVVERYAAGSGDAGRAMTPARRL